MNIRVVLLSLVAIAALVAAFFLGFNDGKRKMDDFCGLVIRGTSAGAHAESLSMHMDAINAVNRGDLAQAARLLHLLARVDAETIIDCKSDPNCQRLSGTHSPEQALVQEALNWK
jgi:hypothetical protein